jgi:hypothetical protein
MLRLESKHRRPAFTRARGRSFYKRLGQASTYSRSTSIDDTRRPIQCLFFNLTTKLIGSTTNDRQIDESIGERPAFTRARGRSFSKRYVFSKRFCQAPLAQHRSIDDTRRPIYSVCSSISRRQKDRNSKT